MDQDESPFHAFVAEGVLRLEENILTKNIWLRKTFADGFLDLVGFSGIGSFQKFSKPNRDTPSTRGIRDLRGHSLTFVFKSHLTEPQIYSDCFFL